jgi:hypothetical protein
MALQFWPNLENRQGVSLSVSSKIGKKLIFDLIALFDAVFNGGSKYATPVLRFCVAIELFRFYWNYLNVFELFESFHN